VGGLPSIGNRPGSLRRRRSIVFGSSAVRRSSLASQCSACSREWPHISAAGRSEVQTAGRSGRPKRRQRSASSSCTHGTPAGLPSAMPGIGELIDGAVQQAAQPGRHSIVAMLAPARTGKRSRPRQPIRME
jgi:hypothetical protein